MQLNETVPVPETTEPVTTLPMEPEQSETQTVEVVLVDVERPFLETGFMDYTVQEGLLLLIFVVVVLDFFYGLIRR